MIRSIALLLACLAATAGCGGSTAPAPSGPQEPPAPTLEVTLPGEVALDMVWIAPGTFTMGSPASEEGRNEDEDPAHTISISQGFYLGRFEITQAQWHSIMGNDPDTLRSPTHPRQNVSWDQVQLFIRRLNATVAGTPYRLPSEAEWEYACRAGTQTAWSFGDDISQLPEYAWFLDNTPTPPRPHAIGLKRPNPWGLYDMHGNMREWCQDWYGIDYYQRSPRTDPPGPGFGRGSILRGGGFGSQAGSTRSANRSGDFGASSAPSYGLRLVRQL